MSLKRKAGSTNYRRFKKSLQTNDRYLRIKKSRYIATFDLDFSAGTEPADLIQQIDKLMEAGEILKDGDMCYVSRIIWNNRNVVVKRYNHISFIHSLRHTIKRSRARRGWLNAYYLKSLGMPTPQSVAYIEQLKGLLVWKSYLVTEYAEGRKLRDFMWDDDITESRRLAELKKVGKLFERLWKYRITHGDLKHTNILMTKGGPVLTDLDGMVVHRFGLLYHSKQTKDIRRFLKKTDIPPELYDYCRELVSSTNDVPHKYDDDFVGMRIDNWSILAEKGLSENDIRDLLSISDTGSQDRFRFAEVPSSNSARVFKCSISAGGDGRTFYFKKYLCRSIIDFIKHLLRPSRARRAFNASLMLLRNGFDAPAVAGLFERRLGPFCMDNFLLTEEVVCAGSIAQVLKEMSECRTGDAIARKHALIESFAETVGRMHSKGIFHGDLRLGNVLVVDDRQKWRFFFLDNERTRKFYRLPSRLRLKNLVQVNMFRDGITNTDRMRFFKTYLNMNPNIQINYRKWANNILSKTLRRLRRKDWFKG